MDKGLKQRWEECKRSAQIHGPAMSWEEFIGKHPWVWPMWNNAYTSNTGRTTPDTSAQSGEAWNAAINALRYYADPKTNAPGAVARDALEFIAAATASAEHGNGVSETTPK